MVNKIFNFLIVFVLILLLPRISQAATIYVNSINDNLNPGDTTCTLREAITIANQNSISGYTECAVSGTLGDDIILFTSNLANQTIILYSDLPSIVAESTGGKLVIDGEDRNITISGNNQRRVFTVSQSANVTFKNLTISNANYGTGGGMYVDINATVNIDGVSFIDNLSVGSYGIAIYNKGILTINNSLFFRNSGISIIENRGKLILRNSTFSNNTLYDGTKSGVIVNEAGIPSFEHTISNCRFKGNSGRVIYNDVGKILISKSFFSENQGWNTIRNFGFLTIDQSTFSKNTSAGGTVHNYGGPLIVINTTFSENYSGSEGGAIYSTEDPNSNPRVVHLNFVTIVGNTAGKEGAGIYAKNRLLSIKNSIIANNKLSNGTSKNCYVTTISALGKNFSTDTTCGTGFDVVTYEQLKLGPLQDNGGPTPTIALKPGSVAINSVTDCTDVNNNPVTIDQRGIKRPYGTSCDSGAYEYNPYKIVFRVTNPKGGERWKAGQSYTIRWEAPKNMVKFIIDYTIDNGTTWTNIATITNNTVYNSYNWIVPPQDGRKTQCYIKIRGYNSTDTLVGTDLSDNAFIIEVLKLTSPNGGETLTVGSTHTIKWETYALTKTVARVQLQYSTNNGQTWTNIATVTGNPGQYNWTVPNTPSTNCKVRVILKDDAGAIIASDISDRVFTIQE